jgi:Cys-rich protein (TIGR01571 family)
MSNPYGQPAAQPYQPQPYQQQQQPYQAQPAYQQGGQPYGAASPQPYGSQQPYGTSAPAMGTPLMQPSDWSSGLCSCFEDCNICLCSFLCCGFQTAYNRAHLEGRAPECLDHCLGCLLTIASCYLIGHLVHSCIGLAVRGDVRKKFMFPEAGCMDCLQSFFCLECSIAQIGREIKHRQQTGQLPMPAKM